MSRDYLKEPLTDEEFIKMGRRMGMNKTMTEQLLLNEMSKEENKYYTPEIEEFHVGFEYELRQASVWQKERVEQNDCFCDLQGEGIRVKHLDREDIESCVLEVTDNVLAYGRNDDYFTEWEIDGSFSIWISNGSPSTIWIKRINMNNGEQNDVPFEVKNKSELKRVLKMIGI